MLEEQKWVTKEKAGVNEDLEDAHIFIEMNLYWKIPYKCVEQPAVCGEVSAVKNIIVSIWK